MIPRNLENDPAMSAFLNELPGLAVGKKTSRLGERQSCSIMSLKCFIVQFHLPCRRSPLLAAINALYRHDERSSGRTSSSSILYLIRPLHSPLHCHSASVSSHRIDSKQRRLPDVDSVK